jgi:hypothetical protein
MLAPNALLHAAKVDVLWDDPELVEAMLPL